jgi:thiol-disulfide isomerase/thioredoxin
VKTGRGLGACLAVAVAAATLCASGPLEASEQPKLIRPDQYEARIVAPKKGRVLVVHFWATWCEPCREEMPELAAAASPASGRDLAVVLVSLDTRRTASSDVTRFLSREKVGFVSFLMKTHDPRLFFHAVDPSWEGTIPLTVVYGRDGRVASRLRGRQSRDTLAAAIQTALAAPAVH